MHTKQMTITPELAKQFLTQNTNNRAVRTSVVKRYAADMLAGNFLLMPHGIVFLKDGTLADGQHRLLAIVDSQTSQSMMVTFDADPEIHLFQDRLAVRKEHDCLKMAGFEWSSSESVAVLKIIISSKAAQKSATTSEIMEAATPEVVEAIAFVDQIFSTRKKSLSTAPVRAAIVLALLRCEDISRDRLAHFAQVLLHGHGNGDADSAAITLRNNLISTPDSGRGSSERERTLRIVQACLKVFLDEKLIRRVPKHQSLIWPKIGGAA